MGGGAQGVALQNLRAAMRGASFKCFEEVCSEGIRCGEKLFPGSKARSPGRVLLVNVGCENAHRPRRLRAEEDPRPHTPSARLSVVGMRALVLSCSARLFGLLRSVKVGYTC